MYLDVKGLVTTGMGNLIDSPADAEQLAWQHTDGTPASTDEIDAESSGRLEARLSPTPTPAPAAPRVYVVRSGNTLSGIARQFYGDAKRRSEIRKANGITNPNLIHTGDRLTIP